MQEWESPAQLAEWLADQVGIWDDDVRSPWVADVRERIEESARKQRLLDMGRDAEHRGASEQLVELRRAALEEALVDPIADHLWQPAVAFGAGLVAGVLICDILWRSFG